MNKLLLSLLVTIAYLILPAQTLTQQWATSLAGIGDNSDKFNDFEVDNNGNTYAVGFTYKQGNGKDFLFVKFNSTGDTVFTRTYDDVGNGNDELESVTMDNSGNVIVCGTSKTLYRKDITTAKFDINGNLLWWNSYNGPGNLDDNGVVVKCDAAGNIYAGGYGYNAMLNTDFIVIKYSPSGSQQAVGFYNGAENLNDELNDLLIDGSGNVIATGQSRTSGSKDDYATVKWNSSLAQQWTATLDNANKTDRSKAVFIDASNNVYITGRSDNGNDDDYVTQKLNGSDGTQIWIKVYDSNGEDQATSIAGNDSIVIVTGSRFNGLQKDIQTVAYHHTSGNVLWSKTYSNANGKDEVANHITIGSNGAVVVTGSTNISTSSLEDNDVLILEYDIAGNQQGATITGGSWSKNDNGEKSWVESNGNIYTVGGLANTTTMKDAWLYKQDAGGAALLNKFYQGEGEFTDKATTLAHSGGSVFAAGYVYSYDEDKNFCTVKYDASGNVVWQKYFNGPDSDTDEPVAIEGDGAGNVYVAGRSKNADNNYDMFLIKYNSNGDTLWTENFDFGLLGDEEVKDMVVSSTGDVYLTGLVDNDVTAATSNDFLTVKISSSGTFLWMAQFNGSANGDDRAYSITLDNNENAIVVGRTWNGSDYDMQTVKYDAANGSETLLGSYTSNLGDDVPEKVLLDNNGNIIVAATSDRDVTASTDRDFLVVKYSNSGTQLWAQTYNGAGTGDDDLKDMVIDPTGNIYVTGQSDMDSTSTDNLDYTTIKFDATGTQEWVVHYNGGVSADDASEAITLLNNGNICVTGQSAENYMGVLNKNATTIVYSPNGSQLSLATYDGVPTGADAGESVLFYNGAIYVGGYGTYTTANQKDFLLINYDLAVGISEHETPMSVSVYPNPTRFQFTVSFTDLGIDNNTELIVTDISGRKVFWSTPDSAVLQVLTDKWNSGVYFLQIKSSRNSFESKIIIQ